MNLISVFPVEERNILTFVCYILYEILTVILLYVHLLFLETKYFLFKRSRFDSAPCSAGVPIALAGYFGNNRGRRSQRSKWCIFWTMSWPADRDPAGYNDYWFSRVLCPGQSHFLDARSPPLLVNPLFPFVALLHWVFSFYFFFVLHLTLSLFAPWSEWSEINVPFTYPAINRAIYKFN